LVSKVRDGEIKGMTAVIAAEQSDGIGSRDNKWIGGRGNFFVSVAIPISMLPNDLPLQATSVYYGFMMRNVLRDISPDVWLKWPNDLYRAQAKIGGVVTHKLKEFFVIGIGVNLQKQKNSFSALDIEIEPYRLLEIYLDELGKQLKWKQILSDFKVEFEKHRDFFFHHNGALMSLQEAILCDDGSLMIDNERIYNQR